MKLSINLNTRWRLFLVFTLLFSVVFALCFLWFYSFATDLALNNLRTDLRHIATSAASRLDAKDHTELVTSGSESDPYYAYATKELREVRDANPKVKTIYSLVRSSRPDELQYVVTSDVDSPTKPHLREPLKVLTYPQMLKAFEAPTADPDVTVNTQGVWFSGYAPIRDSQNNSVGIVGARMNASSVIEVQDRIRQTTVVAFVIVYASLFLAVSIISYALTRSLSRIASAATSLEQGVDYDPSWLASVIRRSDEMGHLARVFDTMAQQVQTRVARLKQEVAHLRIEIDEAKQAQQVAEIVETDYFKELERKARHLRNQRNQQSDEVPESIERGC